MRRHADRIGPRERDLDESRLPTIGREASGVAPRCVIWPRRRHPEIATACVTTRRQELFDQITWLPEYHLTRAEAETLRARSAASACRADTLVEL